VTDNLTGALEAAVAERHNGHGPAPDRVAVVDWLRLLYGHAEAGWLTVSHRTGADVVTDWVPADDVVEAGAAAVERNRYAEVWVGVAIRRARGYPGQRGGEADCLALPGMWADVDIAGPAHEADDLPPTFADAHELIGRFPLAPTAVVNTGHGLQPWWLFDELVNLDDLDERGAELLDRWEATWVRLAGERGWSVDHVWDLPRMLRVPGTVNRKVEPVVPVVVESLEPSRRYGLGDLDDVLDDRPQPDEPRTASNASTTARGDRPGDRFNAEHTWAELLTADGATFHRMATGRLGPYEQWRRPGVDDHHGGSVDYGGADVLHVFTSRWQVTDPATGATTTLAQNATYTRFGYYAATRHGGDHAAAARALAANYEQRDWTDFFAMMPGARAAPEPRPGPGPTAPATTLPEEFWTARPMLAHIRQAAHARQRSAEAVLHVVLARMSGIAAHTLQVPAIVGAPAPLSYFAAIVANSGVGKSTADAIGAELLPAPEYVADHLPLGSGEGLVEVLFDWVDERDDEGKRHKVRKQVRHNAIVYVDEAEALAELGNRKGSTLLSTLRTIWTGGTIGSTNATAERRRRAPAGSYVYGLVLGLHPPKAALLLDGVDTGTPQRFGFAWASDPTVPDELPDWPGPLDWRPPPILLSGTQRRVSDAIAAEVRRADLARVRGRVTVDPLDAHAGLFRLKAALLFGTIPRDGDPERPAGRLAAEDDDWELAGMLKRQSDAVRAEVVAAVAHQAAHQEADTQRRLAGREVAKSRAVEADRVVDTARTIARKVHAEPDRWTAGALRRWLSNRRDVFEVAAERAAAEGWIDEASEPGQGGARRALRPGPKRPP